MCFCFAYIYTCDTVRSVGRSTVHSKLWSSVIVSYLGCIGRTRACLGPPLRIETAAAVGLMHGPM